MSLRRRRFLRTAAVATVPLAAGCSGTGDGDGETPTGENGSNVTVERPTPTEVDPEPLKSTARSAVESLAAGEYEAAHSEFAPFVQDTVTPENLQSNWESLTEEHGAYSAIGDVGFESGDDRDHVTVVVEFESGQETFRFNFADGSLTGFSTRDTTGS